MIDALKNAYRLKELLDCLHLSKSSYFYQERVLNRPDKYQNLRQEIRDAFAAVNSCYGYRRLHAVLKGLGRSVSEKVIRRVMKEERLVVRNIRQQALQLLSWRDQSSRSKSDRPGFPCGKAKREVADRYHGISFACRQSVSFTDH